jgi:hypothetical protein
MVLPSPFSIVMEFASEGDLAHKITELQKKGSAISEA